MMKSVTGINAVYGLVSGTLAIIGLTAFLIGFYRRCDGMTVGLLIGGWGVLGCGIAGIAWYCQAIYAS